MQEFENLQINTENLNGIMIGCVEDNLDPNKMGRLRVRILGLHVEDKTILPTESLPWAMPTCPIDSGAVSGMGTWSIPVQGSWVCLFFLNGNPTFPIYFATLPGNPTSLPNINVGFNDPSGAYPNIINEPDWNRLARGVIAGTSIETQNNNLVTGEPSSPAAPQYPYNKVSENKAIVIEQDSTPGVERYRIYHKPTGTYTEFRPDGSIVQKVVKDKYEIILGDDDIYITGNKNETISNQLTITVGSTVLTAINNKITIQSGDIELGNSTLYRLVNEVFITLFNNHRHPYWDGTTVANSGVPTTEATVGVHTTNDTIAS